MTGIDSKCFKSSGEARQRWLCWLGKASEEWKKQGASSWMGSNQVGVGYWKDMWEQREKWPKHMQTLVKMEERLFAGKQKEKIENDNPEALWVPGNQKLKGQL